MLVFKLNLSLTEKKNVVPCNLYGVNCIVAKEGTGSVRMMDSPL